MLIDKARDSVASWWFEDPVPPPADLRKVLTALLDRTVAVAEILERHELLFPRAVTMTRWMRPDASAASGAVLTEVSPARLAVPEGAGAGDLGELLRRFVAEHEREHGFLFPHRIEVTGPGVVLDAHGARDEVENLTWIMGTKLGELVISVSTQIDAWLPHDLEGKAQPEIYRANAPRLESALKEIRAHLGFDPIEDDDTPYSRKVGFRLDNVRYADGTVVDVS